MAEKKTAESLGVLAEKLKRQLLERCIEKTKHAGCEMDQVKTAIAALKEIKGDVDDDDDGERTPPLPYRDDAADRGEAG